MPTSSQQAEATVAISPLERWKGGFGAIRHSEETCERIERLVAPFAHGCTWAHLVQEAARMLGHKREDFLTPEECRALDGRGDPRTLFS